MRYSSKLFKIYRMQSQDDESEYLNRYDLIRHHILSIATTIYNVASNPMIHPQELIKRIRNSARIICGWANIHYDREKDVFENLAMALRQIRKSNIIYTKLGRADILLRTLKDVVDAINLTELYELKYIGALYLWAVSNIVYDIDIEKPQRGQDIAEYVENLIIDYYKHNVLPKPVETVYADLKKDDEFASVFFDDIYTRIERNTNNLIFIEGEHGVGKSYTALALAREIDPDFEPEEQIVFDIPQFIERCNEMKRKNLMGKVIIFDEVGAAASALTSWELENILFDRYLQLFRYLRLTVIFTARDISDTIRRLRKRVTHYIVMEEQQRCEIYRVKSKFDMQKDKLEVVYEPYYYEDDYNIYLLKFKVPRVPADLAKIYEELRDKNVTSKYLEKIEEEVKLMRNDKLLSEIARDFIENWLDCEEAYISKGPHKGKISVAFIAEKYNIGEKTARKVRNLIYKLLKEKEQVATSSSE
ncbi:ATP-binding protein [Methanocaldococcus sp.]|uniref:ATP-binding protein n=1 Tax=Methanocaldococcus sp. TaxID=2152917 RepID=UPI00260FD971|nr:ATP-binding protein [Methanocaldococcus sp.]MCQ6254753.1 ATP-binding protein [Methanocaldococcus sp.]